MDASELRILQQKAAALDEWIEKTKWVQEQSSTFQFATLGQHYADIMRKEIYRLRELVAQPYKPPKGWKLVPDWQIGMRALFRGVEYVIYARGDRPGTFDICLPEGKQGDRYLSVPPEALQPLTTPT